jgi:mRNA-degrading endonuclease RelE of RelBE toxin-antitoxin system
VALIIPTPVLKQMKAMPKADQARIIEALEQVAADLTVRMPFVTEMAGEPGIWRLRKGDWRATFVIEGADVVVTRVGNRREVYR